ncbi:MAG: hypothetical protein H8E14_18255 [Candidatus Marinimicrobia bacterium]|nr:hypothetical protein [Candidatus Neomarinimicrobiota bacterium]
MNRRLTVGLVLAAILVPGMIHFYAGEKTHVTNSTNQANTLTRGRLLV